MTVILLLLSNLAIVNAFELKYYNIIDSLVPRLYYWVLSRNNHRWLKLNTQLKFSSTKILKSNLYLS